MPATDRTVADATRVTAPDGAHADCSTSLAQSGATSTHCAWSFEYRSAVAQTAFDALLNAVDTCLDPSVTPIQDQSVNHPDGYVLQTFTTPDAEIAVSLKDKGALQQTFVFLRMTSNR